MNRCLTHVIRALSACLLAMVPPILRGDSVLETISAAVTELELEAQGIQLTVHLRERDIPDIRASLEKRMPAPPAQASCDDSCLGQALVHLSFDKAGPTPTQPLEVRVIEARNGEPDHRFVALYRYSRPDGYRQLFVAPTAAELKIAFLALQEGVPISDRVSLDRPVQIEVDWSNPWRSRFLGVDWRRRHLEPKSYLYLEANELRHELLQPLMTLPPDLSLDVNSNGVIAEGERRSVENRVAHYLAQANSFNIDGQPVTPLLGKVEFVRQGAKGIEPVPPGVPLYRRSAMLGLVMTYPTGAPVRQFGLTWKTFGKGETVHGIQIIRGEEAMDSDITPQHPELTWSEDEFMERSAATPPLSRNAQAAVSGAMLAELLLHTYRAFRIREEEAAYDHFAQSLDPPLLDRVYLDQRRSLIERSRGLGGDSRVQRVELTAMKPLAANPHEASIDARWIAHGTVSHWGHSHPRHNQYRAIVHLHRQAGGNWKIDALNFVDGQRLSAS